MKRNFSSEDLAKIAGVIHMGNGPFAKSIPWQLHDSLDAGEAELIKLIGDSQPTAITIANSGVPTFFSTWMEPKVIQVLFSPMVAAEFAGGEVKKGDWTSTSLRFKVLEKTGRIAAYGDRTNAGRSDVNMNFPAREQFRFQTFIDYGDLEQQEAALAGVSLASEKAMSAALALSKFMNLSYLYGVSGLQCYGLLNDPGLSTPVTPTTKTVGGTSWATPGVQPQEILADFQKLFGQLLVQTNGLAKRDLELSIALPPGSEQFLLNSSLYNEPAISLVRKAFSKITYTLIPEYATTGGNVLQMMVREYAGQKTVDCAFTEKMRAHPLIVESSAWHQKRSAGTAGAIYYQPMMTASMIGI